jgi:uncharacterized protein YdcH (DUF465 family)
METVERRSLKDIRKELDAKRSKLRELLTQSENLDRRISNVRQSIQDLEFEFMMY